MRSGPLGGPGSLMIQAPRAPADLAYHKGVASVSYSGPVPDTPRCSHRLSGAPFVIALLSKTRLACRDVTACSGIRTVPSDPVTGANNWFANPACGGCGGRRLKASGRRLASTPIARTSPAVVPDRDSATRRHRLVSQASGAPACSAKKGLQNLQAAPHRPSGTAIVSGTSLSAAGPGTRPGRQA